MSRHGDNYWLEKISSLTTGLAASVTSKATDSTVLHLAGAETATGPKTFSGGVNPGAGAFRAFATGNALNVLNSSSGTDTAATAAGDVFYAALPVLYNSTLTGVTITVGTTNTANVIVSLYNGNGALLANSALNGTSGTALSTVGAKQSIPFTAPVNVIGLSVYYIAVQLSGTGGRIRTFANTNEGFDAGKIAGTGSNFGTVASTLAIVTSPRYTAGCGPFANTY